MLMYKDLRCKLNDLFSLFLVICKNAKKDKLRFKFRNYIIHYHALSYNVCSIELKTHNKKKTLITIKSNFDYETHYTHYEIIFNSKYKSYDLLSDTEETLYLNPIHIKLYKLIEDMDYTMHKIYSHGILDKDLEDLLDYYTPEELFYKE